MENTHQKIIDFIITGIREKEFTYSTRMPTENELSKKLNVSRGTIRESLKILQYMGIITSNQGSGYRINENLSQFFKVSANLLLSLNKFEPEHIADIREALEEKEVALIKEKLEYEQKCDCKNLLTEVESLKEYIEVMKQFRDKENTISVDMVINADMNFHLKLSKLCGNLLIFDIMEALSKVSEAYILIPWNNISLTQIDNLILSHENIINYIINNISDTCNPVVAHYKTANDIIEQISQKTSLEQSRQN